MRWRTALVLMLLLAGCYTARYETRAPRGTVVRQQRLAYYLWGFAGRHEVDLDAMCPGGVAAWRDGMELGDAVLTFVTLGVYAPRTVTVTCREP